MLTFIWLAVLSGVALWSLLGWGLYRLLAMDHAWLGEMQPLIDRVPFGPWLDQWVPGWQALVEFAVDAVKVGLDALGAAAPVAVWLVWGAGTLALVGFGAVLSLVVVVLRDKASSRAAGAGP